MKTIKELSANILKDFGNTVSKPTPQWSRCIAKNMITYCNYLKDVLQNCKDVKVRVVTFPGTKYINAGQALTVTYSHGSSKIVIDDIYTALLLPEIENLLKKYKKRLIYKTEDTRLKAA